MTDQDTHDKHKCVRRLKKKLEEPWGETMRNHHQVKFPAVARGSGGFRENLDMDSFDTVHVVTATDDYTERRGLSKSDPYSLHSGFSVRASFQRD